MGEDKNKSNVHEAESSYKSMQDPDDSFTYSGIVRNKDRYRYIQIKRVRYSLELSSALWSKSFFRVRDSRFGYSKSIMRKRLRRDSRWKQFKLHTWSFNISYALRYERTRWLFIYLVTPTRRADWKGKKRSQRVSYYAVHSIRKLLHYFMTRIPSHQSIRQLSVNGYLFCFI